MTAKQDKRAIKKERAGKIRVICDACEKVQAFSVGGRKLGCNKCGYPYGMYYPREEGASAPSFRYYDLEPL